MTFAELSQEDKEAIWFRFTVAGSCGCDGAYDNGCPSCNPEELDRWLEAKRLGVEYPLGNVKQEKLL